ncbi:carbohydrate binding [Branchiostoma belcheri]|nr:carbohydrate binding [Branchiostoma belcheri]
MGSPAVANADSTEDEYGFGESCDDCGFRIFVSPEDLDETHRNIRETLDRQCMTCGNRNAPGQSVTPDEAGLSLPGTVSTLGPAGTETDERVARAPQEHSTARSSNSTAAMERKKYQCKKCRVHGVDAPLKVHKGICPWQHCACNDCEQLPETARNGRMREDSPKRDDGLRRHRHRQHDEKGQRHDFEQHPKARGGREKTTRTRLQRCTRDILPAGQTTTTAQYDGASPMASTSRNDGACPSTSSMPDFALQDDVMTLTELFPGAQENLGLSALMDIRAGASNMESAVEKLIKILKPTTPSSLSSAITTPSPKSRCPPRVSKLSAIFPQVTPRLRPLTTSPESLVDMLRSIFAMYRYRYRLDELMTEGVHFKHHIYVPEKDGRNFIHRREDHCHLLKRIAMHLRKEPPRWFNHYALENALRPQDGEPTPGLTEASLFGLRKKSVTVAEILLSNNMARFLRHRGHLREASYVDFIAGWYDGRELTEDQRRTTQ